MDWLEDLPPPDVDSERTERRELSEAERAARREAAMRAAGTWREAVGRTDDEWRAILPRYPPADAADADDETAWRLAFEPDDAEGIAAALATYGVAVINVLSGEEADATALDLLADASAAAAEKRSGTVPLAIDDPDTWGPRNWPSKSKFLLSRPAFTQRAFANRTHPSVYRVFRDLYGEERLWASIDNWGVMRGSAGLTLTDPETGAVAHGVERPKWRSQLAPHWDCNPWRIVAVDRAEGHPQRFQGLIALVDCPPSTGTFACVPGSSAFLDTWVAEHPRETLRNQSVRPKKDEPMAAWMQPIPLRKGQMVIWHFELLHANVANASPHMRLIQFVRMMPAWSAVERERSRAKDRYSPPQVWAKYPDVRARIEHTLDLTLLQRRLCGLDEWPVAADDAGAAQTRAQASGTVE